MLGPRECVGDSCSNSNFGLAGQMVLNAAFRAGFGVDVDSNFVADTIAIVGTGVAEYVNGWEHHDG